MPDATAVVIALSPLRFPIVAYVKWPPIGTDGKKTALMSIIAEILDNIHGDKAFAFANPASDRVTSRAKIDPAKGIPMNAVNAPAAPA